MILSRPPTGRRWASWIKLPYDIGERVPVGPTAVLHPTRYMNLGAVDVFYGETVTERENRGSFNLLVDLSAQGESRSIVPPGESGTLTGADPSTEPPHLRDQLPLYEAFLYRHIPRSRDEIEGPTSVTTLEVPSGPSAFNAAR